MSEQKLPPSAEVIDAETNVVATELLSEKTGAEIDNNQRLRKLGKTLSFLIITIAATYLSTCYVIYKYGNLVFGSAELQDNMETIVADVASKNLTNREKLKIYRDLKNEKEDAERDQIDLLNNTVGRLRVELKTTRSELEAQSETIDSQYVPLEKFNILKAKHDQQAGRINDLENAHKLYAQEEELIGAKMMRMNIYNTVLNIADDLKELKAN